MSWLRSARVKGAIIGDVAASLHGRPRVTRDVDLVVLVPDEDWAEFVASGKVHGIVPRRADALAFARRTRVLLMRHDPSSIELDVSLGALPFEHDLVSRRESRRIGRVTMSIASAEDILVMKALALRPRDVADVESILDLNEKLDLRRVRATVAALDEMLEGQDHVGAFDAIVRAAKRRR